jgi:hypothetical protein
MGGGDNVFYAPHPAYHRNFYINRGTVMNCEEEKMLKEMFMSYFKGDFYRGIRLQTLRKITGNLIQI